jgi:DNA-binding response OmpR family regulator
MKREKRILVVDDEPDNISVFSIGLEDEGFTVDTFTDPQLALSAFKAKTYDLLILDIKMPIMNGFELYEKIIKIDNKLKVCFLTAFGEGYYEEFRRKFPTPSSSDVNFVRKPIRIDELVKKVNGII